MKKIIIVLGIVLTTLFLITQVKKQNSHNKKSKFTIGILQTASHPALDAVRDGFVKELEATLGHDIAFEVKNGEGSISNLTTIAQQFHIDKNISLVYAIATPATQAIASVEAKKPILFAAVTDPYALGIMRKETNISGSRDMIDIPAQIDMVFTLLPQIKTVGLIYNNGEINSIAAARLMKEELKIRDIKILDFAVSSEADLPSAAQMAFLKTDVVVAPTDNMVASSISLLSTLAKKYNKPLIVSDNMLVKFGALGSRGIDYKDSGKQAAQLAYALLHEGKTPVQLGVHTAPCEKIYINKLVLEELELNISPSMKDHVVLL